MREIKGTRKSRVAGLLLLALLVPAGPSPARMIANPDTDDDGGAGGPQIDYVHPANGFIWSAPKRMEGWKGAWSQRLQTRPWPKETYDPNYVNPTSWKLTMMGCQTENDYLYNLDPDRYKELQDEEPDAYPGPQYKYRWEWNGHNTNFTTDCYGELTFPSRGIFYVTLTVKNLQSGNTQTWTNPVEVKDFLIVVLGDSSASGEGAPDVPLTEATNGRAEWVDNRCHRSNYAGGAQAARRIEDGNPHTSVTFLSFACSGATLATDIYDVGMPDPYNPTDGLGYRGVGMTGPYAGIEPHLVSGEPYWSDKLPSQTDQLWNALTNFGAHKPREIDALLVAGGINDARFADLTAMCVLAPFCYAVQVGVLGPNPRTLASQYLDHDVQSVPGGWDVLNDQLTAPHTLNDGTTAFLKINNNNKLALQYPPFLHDEDGDRCTFILSEALPPWAEAMAILFFTPLFPPGWAVDEIDDAIEDWAPALDANVKWGAERNGFKYVDTIAGRFHLHGICADDNWFNTPDESAEIEGDAEGEEGKLASMSTKGSAHPTIKGYAAYADEILRNLNSLTKKDGGNTPPVAAADKVSAARGLESTFNVLDNDSDDDPLDVLSATVKTQPLHGTLTMKNDGSAKYKPAAGYVGSDIFAYELTDGTDITTGYVNINVMLPIGAVIAAEAGEVVQFPGILGGYPLAPPYRLELDRSLPGDYGDLYIDHLTGIVEFEAPPTRHRRIRIPFTVFSDITDITSPSYGESVRGRITLKVRRPRP